MKMIRVMVRAPFEKMTRRQKKKKKKKKKKKAKGTKKCKPSEKHFE